MKGLFKILGNVAKTAIKETTGVNLDMFKKTQSMDSAAERRTHELAVILTQLMCSVISLIKFIRRCFPKKPIKL